jgi:CRP-like cAMP-binding protein
MSDAARSDTVGHPKAWAASNENLLLASLPNTDRQLVLRHCELVTVEAGRALYDPHALIAHVHFPIEGLVSLLSAFTDGTGVETAIIGREGMAGIALFHGTDRMPEQAVAQLPLKALRMPGDAFRACVAESAPLREALHHYATCLFVFAAQSAACASKHDTTRRLARWLLHAADHTGVLHLELTHLFLSHMLGVRRSSVSVAANKLRKKGLLTYTRKRIDILDLDALSDAACECYAIVRYTYDRVLFGRKGENPLAEVVSSRRGISTLDSPTPEKRNRS